MREKSSEQLVLLGDIALEKLFPLLSSDDPEIRSRVNRILARLIRSPLLVQEAFKAGTAGVAWIANADSATNPDKRLFDIPVAAMAGFYGGPEITPFLARRAASGDATAADSLGLLGCPEEAFDELVSIFVREKTPAAVIAIGSCGSRRARDFLRQFDELKDVALARAARSALRDLDAFEASERLAVLLARRPNLGKFVFAQARRLQPRMATRFAHCFLRESVAMDPEVAAGLLPSFEKIGLDMRLFGFRRCRHLVGAVVDRVEAAPGSLDSYGFCAVLAGFYDEPRAVDAMYRALIAFDRPYLLRVFKGTGDFGVAAAVEARMARVPDADKVDLCDLLDRPPGALAVRALGSALRSNDPALVNDSARALALHATPDCIDELFNAIALPRARRACALALADSGSKVGFERLHTLAVKGCPPRIYEALGETGDRRAAPILRAACLDRRTAPHALVGLGKLKDPSCLGVLLRALTDDRLWLSALDGLAELGSRDALPAIAVFAEAAQTRRNRKKLMKAEAVINYLKMR